MAAIAALLVAGLVGTGPPPAHPKAPAWLHPSSSDALPAGGSRRLRIAVTGPIKQEPTPGVVLAAKTAAPVIALTFDLDMTPAMMQQARAGASWFNADALVYLRSQRAHATMFMTGLWAEMYPALARQLAQDPSFEIANHSYTHPAFHLPCYGLGSLSRGDQARQIQMAQESIRWVTGVTPRYFRFPGGCYDPQALDLVRAAGLSPIQWSVNSIDAFNPYSSQIAAAVLSQVKPGSIVLMHLHGGSNAPATADALRLIIPTLRQRGYRLATVSELLATAPPILDPREIVEVHPLPALPVVAAPNRPVRLQAPQPLTRRCGWVTSREVRTWVCR
jgi:peptidoglycan/xylan/chitin deacetylase (PgdA/CDA1 family)